MLIIQLSGLLWFNWSGLYVIYLCWIDLFFLTVYTIVRERQFRRDTTWISFKNRRAYLFEVDHKMFYFIRIISLCFYLLLIGSSAIPYEKSFIIDEDHLLVRKDYEIHSIGDFFTGLLVSDPLFIISVFFVAYFYLKKLAAKPDTSEEALVEFSFHLSSNDPHYAYPLLAVMTFIIPAMVMHTFFTSSGELRSYLFTYAIWLLLFRFLTELLTDYRIRKEINRSF